MNEKAADERTLSKDLQMGAVTLRVGDLQLMSDYYTDALALTPITEETVSGETILVLGRGETPLVRLQYTPGLPEVDPRAAGLFHTAFLFEDQAALAATVYRSAKNDRSRFAGSSDHLVSEAFYFTDPEGNGIELYFDRPRTDWRYSDGEIQMDTIFLDPNVYLQTHLDENVLESIEQKPAKVGHVHLQVGDVATAKDFYVDVLGFETTFGSIPSALFASAGGYHHHVAMNTWNSRGAGPRAASLGLGDLAIKLPNREHLDALIARLKNKGLQFADTGKSVIVNDPWGTQVTVLTNNKI